MMELYDKMTNFLWPIQWMEMVCTSNGSLAVFSFFLQDALSGVDQCVMDLREHLFRQYEVMHNATNGVGILDASHAVIVSDRLSLLLSASAAAFTLEAAAKDRTCSRVYPSVLTIRHL